MWVSKVVKVMVMIAKNPDLSGVARWLFAGFYIQGSGVRVCITIPRSFRQGASLKAVRHGYNYKILFVQGGGHVQFAMVPMNLMKNGVACYIETGAWSQKAIKEAQKYGTVKISASSKDKNFSYVPDCSNLDIPS